MASNSLILSFWSLDDLSLFIKCSLRISCRIRGQNDRSPAESHPFRETPGNKGLALNRTVGTFAELISWFKGIMLESIQNPWINVGNGMVILQLDYTCFSKAPCEALRVAPPLLSPLSFAGQMIYDEKRGFFLFTLYNQSNSAKACEIFVPSVVSHEPSPSFTACEKA